MLELHRQNALFVPVVKLLKWLLTEILLNEHRGVINILLHIYCGMMKILFEVNWSKIKNTVFAIPVRMENYNEEFFTWDSTHISYSHINEIISDKPRICQQYFKGVTRSTKYQNGQNSLNFSSLILFRPTS